LQHIPYKGNAPAMLDVISDSAACMFDILITAIPQIQAGKVRPIAITSRTRSPYLPDVPTMAEAGLPAYDAAGNDLWFGLFAPAKTPPAVIEKLNAAVIASIQSEELQKVVRGMYYEPWTLSPANFTVFLQTDRAKWSKVVRDSGAKAE
jgi:tripartite-type tricarboxylate transporter receptor subunit TctC